jgi:hypothetical protein
MALSEVTMAECHSDLENGRDRDNIMSDKDNINHQTPVSILTFSFFPV